MNWQDWYQWILREWKIQLGPSQRCHSSYDRSNYELVQIVQLCSITYCLLSQLWLSLFYDEGLITSACCFLFDRSDFLLTTISVVISPRVTLTYCGLCRIEFLGFRKFYCYQYFTPGRHVHPPPPTGRRARDGPRKWKKTSQSSRCLQLCLK